MANNRKNDEIILAALRSTPTVRAAALQTHLGAAIEAMGEIVNDKETNPQTRLNAAEAVIRNTLKLTERTDVLDRLDALERLNK